MQAHLQSNAIHSQTTRSRSRQAGFSLVELSVALAISAVVLMAALAGVRKLVDSSNANTALTQMGSSIANMSKTAQALGDQSIYDDTLLMGRMGVFDNASVIRGGENGAVSQIRNPFGGYVWTSRNKVLADDAPINTALWYVVTGVPNSACPDLVTGLNNSAYSIYVSAASDASKQFNGTNPASVGVVPPPKVKGGAMSPANVQASCSDVGTTKDIYVLTNT
jgi:prepilin-type N-terminal cleavage/methylation domain-containing protein